MRRFIRQNSLSLVVFGLFALFVVGQSVVGLTVYNEEQQEHGDRPVGYLEYLVTGHFGEAVFENWESEFLQMGALVLLTVWLRQKGSPESKKLDQAEPVDKEPRARKGGRTKAPWPVRRGGIVFLLYENSLAIALLGLFALSFALHALSGVAAYNAEQQAHGQPDQSTAIQYVLSAKFWWESLQNWQSEFLAVGALAVLTVFLRQKGSPESKPVDHPDEETGR